MGRVRRALVIAGLLVACGAAGGPARHAVLVPPPAPAVTAQPPIASPVPPPATPPPLPPVPPAAVPATVEVRYRVEVRTPDPAVADFAEWLRSILTDARGWSQAGFVLVEDPAAPYAVVLAEGPEVDALCVPYDVGGRFSCQNGPVVALNADRWREAVPSWPLDLTAYRTMLVNHEVGHLLGMHHIRCRVPGAVSPVMAQQSGGLDGCLANPWPTPAELTLAATHQFVLAPPYTELPFPP